MTRTMDMKVHQFLSKHLFFQMKRWHLSPPGPFEPYAKTPWKRLLNTLETVGIQFITDQEELLLLKRNTSKSTQQLAGNFSIIPYWNLAIIFSCSELTGYKNNTTFTSTLLYPTNTVLLHCWYCRIVWCWLEGK